MLSVFPELLFLSPLAPFLIRLAVSAAFAYAAWKHAKNPDGLMRGFAVIEGAIAILLLGGAWTQPAAFLSLLVLLSSYWTPRLRFASSGTTLLLLVMALSLLLTGPGAFAVDWPL